MVMDDEIKMHEKAAYKALPQPTNANGAERKIGVEIEFIGLNTADAAQVAKATLGGTLTELNPHRYELHDSVIGDVTIELDIWLAHGAEDADSLEAKARDVAGKAAGLVTPVEIIGPPLPVASLPQMDRLIDALREAGAQGTEAGLLFGFGVHFNVETTGLSAKDILPTLRVFALIEDWIRDARKPDFSRRVLPFIDPYPNGYRDLLAGPDYAPDIGALIDDYLTHNPTRNRSLDMLPLFTMIDAERVSAALGETAKGGRPTYHYRLPNSRVGDPVWSLAEEWSAWVRIEQIAAHPEIFERLASAWRTYRESWTSMRPDWRDDIERIMADFDLSAADIARETKVA